MDPAAVGELEELFEGVLHWEALTAQSLAGLDELAHSEAREAGRLWSGQAIVSERFARYVSLKVGKHLGVKEHGQVVWLLAAVHSRLTSRFLDHLPALLEHPDDLWNMFTRCWERAERTLLATEQVMDRMPMVEAFLDVLSYAVKRSPPAPQVLLGGQEYPTGTPAGLQALFLSAAGGHFNIPRGVLVGFHGHGGGEEGDTDAADTAAREAAAWARLLLSRQGVTAFEVLHGPGALCELPVLEVLWRMGAGEVTTATTQTPLDASDDLRSERGAHPVNADAQGVARAHEFAQEERGGADGADDGEGDPSADAAAHLDPFAASLEALGVIDRTRRVAPPAGATDGHEAERGGGGHSGAAATRAPTPVNPNASPLLRRFAGTAARLAARLTSAPLTQALVTAVLMCVAPGEVHWDVQGIPRCGVFLAVALGYHIGVAAAAGGDAIPAAVLQRVVPPHWQWAEHNKRIQLEVAGAEGSPLPSSPVVPATPPPRTSAFACSSSFSSPPRAAAASSTTLHRVLHAEYPFLHGLAMSVVASIRTHGLTDKQTTQHGWQVLTFLAGKLPGGGSGDAATAAARRGAKNGERGRRRGNDASGDVASPPPSEAARRAIGSRCGGPSSAATSAAAAAAALAQEYLAACIHDAPELLSLLLRLARRHYTTLPEGVALLVVESFYVALPWGGGDRSTPGGVPDSPFSPGAVEGSGGPSDDASAAAAFRGRLTAALPRIVEQLVLLLTYALDAKSLPLIKVFDGVMASRVWGGADSDIKAQAYSGVLHAFNRLRDQLNQERRTWQARYGRQGSDHSTGRGGPAASEREREQERSGRRSSKTPSSPSAPWGVGFVSMSLCACSLFDGVPEGRLGLHLQDTASAPDAGDMSADAAGVCALRERIFPFACLRLPAFITAVREGGGVKPTRSSSSSSSPSPAASDVTFSTDDFAGVVDGLETSFPAFLHLNRILALRFEGRAVYPAHAAKWDEVVLEAIATERREMDAARFVGLGALGTELFAYEDDQSLYIACSLLSFLRKFLFRAPDIGLAGVDFVVWAGLARGRFRPRVLRRLMDAVAPVDAWVDDATLDDFIRQGARYLAGLLTLYRFERGAAAAAARDDTPTLAALRRTVVITEQDPRWGLFLWQFVLKAATTAARRGTGNDVRATFFHTPRCVEKVQVLANLFSDAAAAASAGVAPLFTACSVFDLPLAQRLYPTAFPELVDELTADARERLEWAVGEGVPNETPARPQRGTAPDLSVLEPSRGGADGGSAGAASLVVTMRAGTAASGVWVGRVTPRGPPTAVDDAPPDDAAAHHHPSRAGTEHGGGSGGEVVAVGGDGGGAVVSYPGNPFIGLEGADPPAMQSGGGREASPGGEVAAAATLPSAPPTQPLRRRGSRGAVRLTLAEGEGGTVVGEPRQHPHPPPSGNADCHSPQGWRGAVHRVLKAHWASNRAPPPAAHADEETTGAKNDAAVRGHRHQPSSVLAITIEEIMDCGVFLDAPPTPDPAPIAGLVAQAQAREAHYLAISQSKDVETILTIVRTALHDACAVGRMGLTAEAKAASAIAYAFTSAGDYAHPHVGKVIGRLLYEAGAAPDRFCDGQRRLAVIVEVVASVLRRVDITVKEATCQALLSFLTSDDLLSGVSWTRLACVELVAAVHDMFADVVRAAPERVELRLLLRCAVKLAVYGESDGTEDTLKLAEEAMQTGLASLDIEQTFMRKLRGAIRQDAAAPHGGDGTAAAARASRGVTLSATTARILHSSVGAPFARLLHGVCGSPGEAAQAAGFIVRYAQQLLRDHRGGAEGAEGRTAGAAAAVPAATPPELAVAQPPPPPPGLSLSGTAGGGDAAGGGVSDPLAAKLPAPPVPIEQEVFEGCGEWKPLYRLVSGLLDDVFLEGVLRQRAGGDGDDAAAADGAAKRQQQVEDTAPKRRRNSPLFVYVAPRLREVLDYYLVVGGLAGTERLKAYQQSRAHTRTPRVPSEVRCAVERVVRAMRATPGNGLELAVDGILRSAVAHRWRVDYIPLVVHDFARGDDCLLEWIQWVAAAMTKHSVTPDAECLKFWLGVCEGVSTALTQDVARNSVDVWQASIALFIKICRLIDAADRRSEAGRKGTATLLAIIQLLVVLTTSAEAHYVNGCFEILKHLPCSLQGTFLNTIPWYHSTFHKSAESLFHALRDFTSLPPGTKVKVLECLAMLDWGYLGLAVGPPSGQDAGAAGTSNGDGGACASGGVNGGGADGGIIVSHDERRSTATVLLIVVLSGALVSMSKARALVARLPTHIPACGMTVRRVGAVLNELPGARAQRGGDGRGPVELWLAKHSKALGHPLWYHADLLLIGRRLSVFQMLQGGSAAGDVVAAVDACYAVLTRLFLTVLPTRGRPPRTGGVVDTSAPPPADTEDPAAAAVAEDSAGTVAQFVADVRMLLMRVIQSPPHAQAWAYPMARHPVILQNVLLPLTLRFAASTKVRQFVSTVLSCVSVTSVEAWIKSGVNATHELAYTPNDSSLAGALSQLQLREGEHFNVAVGHMARLVREFLQGAPYDVCVAALSTASMVLPATSNDSAVLLLAVLDAAVLGMFNRAALAEGGLLATHHKGIVLREAFDHLVLPPAPNAAAELIRLCHMHHMYPLLAVLLLFTYGGAPTARTVDPAADRMALVREVLAVDLAGVAHGGDLIALYLLVCGVLADPLWDPSRREMDDLTQRFVRMLERLVAKNCGTKWMGLKNRLFSNDDETQAALHCDACDACVSVACAALRVFAAKVAGGGEGPAKRKAESMVDPCKKALESGADAVDILLDAALTSPARLSDAIQKYVFAKHHLYVDFPRGASPPH